MLQPNWYLALPSAGVPNTTGDGTPTWVTVLGVIVVLILAVLVYRKRMRK